MNCFVKFVGVLDKNGLTHFVEFFSGLNIITGKSSTGKSAVIEIFDYCFGSSDYTVPEGIITTNAEIYFSVLKFQSMALVLARRGESDLCFLKEIHSNEQIDGMKSTSVEFFSDAYFMPLAKFKKELGRYFGVTLTDVDEDISTRDYRGRKSSTPTVRSFTSFMLQHQNLVANKHAIFFRFDEKEKREQTIDHFKVFMGIADQEYFVLSQKLNEKKQELRKIELALPRKAEERENAREQISRALDEYHAISGRTLTDMSSSSIVANPRLALEKISATPIQLDPLSTSFDKQRTSLESNRSDCLAELRNLERLRSAARSSIKFTEKFKESTESIDTPLSTEIALSSCPFCASNNDHIEDEANRLSEAIAWLNNELRLTPYMRESFLEDEKNLSSRIGVLRQKLDLIQGDLSTLDKQTKDLENKRSMSELAMKAKLRVETVLELQISHTSNNLEIAKEKLEKEIREIQGRLSTYDMNTRLAKINRQIEAAMREISHRFDFEESYRPINLKFSLETFDLWHERGDGKKIFLRAMGSGANWLYCHLTLFLAIHRVFALNADCKIPPILFLDQPSQVYFPNFQSDNAADFDPKDLVYGTLRESTVDEDLGAVVNMYKELIQFCEETSNLTKLSPQIIVTDHADHLDLGEGISFDSFVRARWRSRGFIKL